MNLLDNDHIILSYYDINNNSNTKDNNGFSLQENKTQTYAISILFLGLFLLLFFTALFLHLADLSHQISLLFFRHSDGCVVFLV